MLGMGHERAGWPRTRSTQADGWGGGGRHLRYFGRCSIMWCFGLKKLSGYVAEKRDRNSLIIASSTLSSSGINAYRKQNVTSRACAFQQIHDGRWRDSLSSSGSIMATLRGTHGQHVVGQVSKVACSTKRTPVNREMHHLRSGQVHVDGGLCLALSVGPL